MIGRCAVGAALIAALISVACAVLPSVLPPRVLALPGHMLGHAYFEPDLLTAAQATRLSELMKEMKVFPSNVADTSFYKTVREDIGEAQPVDPSMNACADPFLVPNGNRTLCVLPGRIDIGRHFILSGGPTEGLREPYESMISRVQSFGRYMFDLSQYPDVKALFDEPRFLNLARRVCPADKQYLDPFQFNLILQLPGQTVAAHVDGVYFWGATRFQFPQWLLAAMVFSGRFRDSFIDQVQVVAYLHDWDPKTRVKAGEFIHWATPQVEEQWHAKGDPNVSVPVKPLAYDPMPRAGSAIDGSKCVHAAEVYKGSPRSPPLPLIEKNAHNELVYEGPSDESGWVLRSAGKPLQRYSTDDIRTSIVYRARCFRDEAEALRFDGKGGPEEELLSLDSILTTLSDELVKRGVVASVDSAMAMDRKQLAVKIMDTFIKYPLPDRTVRLNPYNYCALPRLIRTPWAAKAAKQVLSLLCR